MAGREIIEGDDLLSALEQGLDQVRADEACSAGDEPDRLALGQALGKFGRKNGNFPRNLEFTMWDPVLDRLAAVNATGHKR